ncbi:MAG: hypothetical protein AB7O64_08685, partial [Methylibium sp.]
MSEPSRANDGDTGPADGLRELRELSMPDTRLLYLAVREGAATRPLEQSDRHEAIAELRLTDQVPVEIGIHYDTARNVYLFAWHVYRFHVVAEQQALASLEMALRLALLRRGLVDERGAAVAQRSQPPNGQRRSRPLGLSQLMSMAAKAGLITNEGLTRREQWAQRLAEERQSIEQIRFMEQNKLDRMVLPDIPVVPSEEEREFDWLAQFVEGLPRLRNEYAHGSRMLHANVLRTFQIVCDLINQLWAGKPVDPGG